MVVTRFSQLSDGELTSIKHELIALRNGAEFDVVTLSNECTFPSAQYLNDWILSAVRECNERGWHCVPTVHYTGSPEIDWLTTMRPALTAMKQGGHMLGINIYPYYPVKLMTRNNDTQYTTYRFELIQAALVRGSDPAIIVTEIAESGGGEYPDLADMIAFAKVIDGKVLVADYWYFGPPLGAWPRATLNGRVEELARGIVAALQ